MSATLSPLQTSAVRIISPLTLMKTFSLFFAGVALTLITTSMAMAADNAKNNTPLGSTIFDWNQLPETSTPVGKHRDVTDQPTRTFGRFECHITTLNPGLDSHPPHRHPQEELIILKEGTLDVNINQHSQRVGPGSVFFFASYDLHNVHNAGATPATYLVFNFTTDKTKKIPTTPAIDSAPAGTLKSSAWDWDQLPVKSTANGERRELADAPTVTSEHLEAHVTTLKPGASAHAPHRHPDEEIVVIKEGLIEATVNGQSQRVGPGSICFYASGDEHGMKNVGPTPATYYVLRIVTSETPKTKETFRGGSARPRTAKTNA